jgi:hypothetical protein
MKSRLNQIVDRMIPIPIERKGGKVFVDLCRATSDNRSAATTVNNYLSNNYPKLKDIAIYVLTLAEPNSRPLNLPFLGNWSAEVKYDKKGVIQVPDGINLLLFDVEKYDAKAEAYFSLTIDPSAHAENYEQFDGQTPGSAHWTADWKFRVNPFEQEKIPSLVEESRINYISNPHDFIQAAYHEDVLIMGVNNVNFYRGILAGTIGAFSRNLPLREITVVTEKGRFDYKTLDAFSF